MRTVCRGRACGTIRDAWWEGWVWGAVVSFFGVCSGASIALSFYWPTVCRFVADAARRGF